MMYHMNITHRIAIDEDEFVKIASEMYSMDTDEYVNFIMRILKANGNTDVWYNLYSALAREISTLKKAVD